LNLNSLLSEFRKKTFRFKKVYLNICIAITLFDKKKLFQKNAKKIFLTPLGLVRQHNHTVVLQLSDGEIIIFLNIPGTVFRGSFSLQFIDLKEKNY